MSHTAAFIDAITASGMTPPKDIIDDGKRHRFSSSGKPKDDTGWYILHGDDRPAGAFGCWRSGISVTWKHDTPKKQFTAEERAAWKKRIADVEAAREADLAEAAAYAAAESQKMWDAARPDAGHDYLTAKKIPGLGARVLKNMLLIPVKHGAGGMVGLQRIWPDGTKRPVKGTPMQGAYHVIGKPARGARVIIVEGYATGVSVHLAIGCCVVVAFNAGNLLPVAEKIRAAMPDAEIVIGSDDDAFTVYPENHPKAGQPWNPGLEAAAVAAHAVGGGIAMPVWTENNRPGKRTDFNDLQADEGLDAVKACFNTIIPATPPESDQAGSAAGHSPENPVNSSAGAPFPPAGSAAAPAASTGPAAGVTVFVPKHAAMQTYGLDGTEKGAYATVANVVRVLHQDETLKQTIWFDEFLDRICTIWRSDTVREWSDIDDINLQIYLQENIGLPKLGKQTVADAVVAYANSDVRNEAKAYIDGLTWDGVPRLAGFLDQCFGAGDTEYTRRAGENFWISMVARVMRPGCKVDTMLVLEGLQGAGKSKALAIIGGKWFAEANTSPTEKDFYLGLAGKMIIEIGEMDAFSRSEVTKVKQVITCQTDRYRAPYERRAADHPRRCVFAGTTNRDDWNKDETGARRFWPVFCHHVDNAALIANRDQYFAEAAAKLAAGATWWDMPHQATLDQQEARRDADELEVQLTKWLLGRPDVTVGEIMSDMMNVPLERQDRALQMRIGKAMRAIKWVRPEHAVMRGSARVRVWMNPRYVANDQELPL